MADIKIISGPSSWIEGAAVQQLHKMAELPGMVRAIGMPDLHPGQGCPVGAVFVTEGRIYPHLIGSDIGCGMSLWTTTIQRPRAERLEKKLKSFESGVENAIEVLHEASVAACGYEHSLGTVGRGNHFVEILIIDEVINRERFDIFVEPAKQQNALLLVHSGSRGYGEKILYEHMAEYQNRGLEWGTPAFEQYMIRHDHALDWARVNREVIASRFFDCLGARGELESDIFHNFVEQYIAHLDPVPKFVHRKGAIPSNRGPVVIPGSRGTHTYLVEPIGVDAATGWSLSHGAGRKMSRRDALAKNKNEMTKNLVQTKLGSRVICEDDHLLAEEAPNAYKNITQVVEDLVDHSLVTVLATLKPVLTYKMRRQ